MISRIAVILFLAASFTAIVSAQSQPKQLTKEEEQKKQEEFRKKIKETLDATASDHEAPGDSGSHVGVVF